MSDAIVLAKNFDPLTKEDVKLIRKYDFEYENLYLYVTGSGLASREDRIAMVKDLKIGRVIENLNLETYRLINLGKTEALKDFTVLDFNTIHIIFEKGLYYEDLVKRRLSLKRYQHSKSVADLCVKLAQSHKYDTNKAFIAGILHDICKEDPRGETLRIIKKYYKERQDEPYPILHAYTGEYFCKNKMRIKDEDILDAIYHHTLGTSDKTLAKILFIADKLDPLRGYDVSKQTKLALENLDEAFKLVKKEQEEYIKRGKDDK